MNAREPLRRGACPGLSAPMPTGDGLLARLTPSGATITLDQFAGLCDAARQHGNGIIEITSRGSIQVRGLSPASAMLFAADIAALAIEASDGIPVLCDPLSDDHTLAAEIRAALTGASLSSRLSAKVSVTVNQPLSADVGLRTIDDHHMHITLAARPFGGVARRHAAGAVRLLLETLAMVAPASRMRDAIDYIDLFKSAVADLLVDVSPPSARDAVEPLGLHYRPSGVVLGIGLPFGHCDAATLGCLMDAGRSAGAAGVRPAPDRALLVMGLTAAAAKTLKTAAEQFGFVIQPSDPRRRIVACAGAPICASGEIPTRALAPLLVGAADSLPDGCIIHVSGCIKGCAHPAPAAIAVVGRAGCGDITVGGVSHGSAAVADLPQLLADVLRARGGNP